MKRVWFILKFLESLLGLICLGYHTRGFLNVDYVQSHYTYCCIFGGFTLMAMFGCLNVVLKETIHPVWEVGLNLLAAVCMIGVSIDSMFHAEKDFYLMYLSASMHDYDDDDDDDTAEEHEKPHPFFKYSKGQSIAALCCGSLFLLHFVFAFDFAIHKDASSLDSETSDEEEDENQGISDGLKLYVCGKVVHKWLEKFEWFKSLK